MTENISQRYTIPTGRSRIGILTANAKAHTKPPRKSEPVSPINTFAGWKFQTRNPRHAPAEAALRAVMPR